MNSKNSFQRDLRSLRRNQYVLYLLIFSLVTIVVWVGVSIARSQQSSQTDPVLIRLSETLDPNINSQVIEELEEKRSYSERELSNFPILQVQVDTTGSEQLRSLDNLPQDTTSMDQDATFSGTLATPSGSLSNQDSQI